tara:strand:+ start:430 stop:588 length:159 start_codon:yes stop_codon:yes gene_type:complete
MKNQPLKINNRKKNFFVKLLITNPKSLSTEKLIKELNDKEIKLNITAVYSFK